MTAFMISTTEKPAHCFNSYFPNLWLATSISKVDGE
jgi:hypothetical protein